MTKHLGNLPSVFQNLTGLGYVASFELPKGVDQLVFNERDAYRFLKENGMDYVATLSLGEEKFLELLQEILDSGWYIGLFSYIKISKGVYIMGFADSDTAVWVKLWEPQ